MKTTIYFMLILYLLIFLAACNKDKNVSSAQIQFNGITATDNSSSIVTKDPTDWRLDDTWTEQESALFPTTSALINGTPDYNYRVLAYPNPCIRTFSIFNERKSGTQMAYRIVDRHYKVLKSADSAATWNFELNTKELVTRPDTVRIYYKIISGTKEFRGHGDISLQPE